MKGWVTPMTALILAGCSTFSPVHRPSAGGAGARSARETALPLEPEVNGAIPIETRPPPAAEPPKSTLDTTSVPGIAPPTAPSRSPQTAPPTTTSSPPPPCQTAVISGAGFAPNSWELPLNMRDLVARTVNQLSAGRYTSINVIGHADSRPSPIGNDELSLRRAQSIVSELITDGIEPTIVQAEGHGDHEPIANGETETAWAANRRIEILAFCNTQGS